MGKKPPAVYDGPRIRRISNLLISIMRKEAPNRGEQAILACALLWYCVSLAEKRGLVENPERLAKELVNEFFKAGNHKKLNLTVPH